MRRKRARYVETASRSLESLALRAPRSFNCGESRVLERPRAEQLCLDHVLNGFQLCAAAKDVDELQKQRTKKTLKQVFLFRRLHGRTFLEAISGHEDSHICWIYQENSLRS